MRLQTARLDVAAKLARRSYVRYCPKATRASRALCLDAQECRRTPCLGGISLLCLRRSVILPHSAGCDAAADDAGGSQACFPARALVRLLVGNGRNAGLRHWPSVLEHSRSLADRCSAYSTRPSGKSPPALYATCLSDRGAGGDADPL